MSDVTLPTPVQVMVDAINAADTDAFVDAFTPTGMSAIGARSRPALMGCANGQAATRSAPERG